MLRGFGHVFQSLGFVEVTVFLQVLSLKSNDQTSTSPFSVMRFITLPEYRSFDGTGNNINNPLWGSANTPLGRLQVKEAYVAGTQDGIPGMSINFDLMPVKIICQMLVRYRIL